MAYFKVCGGDPSALADLLCASLNVVGFTWVAAPAATELEIVMCDWVARLMGLPDCFLSTSPGGGVIQTTASDSLLCAMIAAETERWKASRSSTSRQGVAARDTHSIGGKGCLVLDLPHLRVIPTRRGATDPDNYGLHPDDVAAGDAAGRGCGVSCRSCWCRTGHDVDDGDYRSRCARWWRSHAGSARPLWVHIDGAYGGRGSDLSRVPPLARRRVELVDSLCINPHTSGSWSAMDCSLLWRARPPAADPGGSRSTRVPQEDFMCAVNYKDWQVALGRRFRSLKLWFTLRRFGGRGAGARTSAARSSSRVAPRSQPGLRTGRFTIFTPQCAMGLVASTCRLVGRELNEALLRRVNTPARPSSSTRSSTAPTSCASRQRR
ncbi:hypothetical protein PINS_up014587 [Pythium insidiosum]|nr:hypothetical protein PINS_up014587 [Pythium insidiosum]